MATNEILIPNYADIDFNTFKTKIQEQLEQNSLFYNYNYAGGNITVLIELLAYVLDLNVFYLNKIAKNVYIDSANIYENVSRLANLVGYYPRGSRSAVADLRLTILDNEIPVNSLIKVNAWKSINAVSDEPAIYGSAAIPFSTTTELNLQYPSEFTLDENSGLYYYDGIKAKQGIVKELSYIGSDLIDNTIYLPYLDFGYDDNLDDIYPSILLTVNGVEWIRIADFYEDLSGLASEDNVYMLKYNKYQNYVVEFSSARNVPATTDRIEIKILESLGADSNVSANWIGAGALPEDMMELKRYGFSYYTSLPTSAFTCTNPLPATGGSPPDTIDEIKEYARGMTHAQYRCVTKADYRTYLLVHNSVADANVWGEQENTVGYSGNVNDYNKVYISIVPTGDWSDKLAYSSVTYTDPITHATEEIKTPTNYVPSYLETISTYLEPRKMLCAYEEYVIPDTIYFKFNLSIRIRRNYRFNEVALDLKNKLNYYFVPANRNFGEKISFNDMLAFLLDPTQVSGTERFAKVQGIINLNLRDISWYNTYTHLWVNPYESTSELFPRYIAYSESSFWDENLLKVVQLGVQQFPYIGINICRILEETY